MLKFHPSEPPIFPNNISIVDGKFCEISEIGVPFEIPSLIIPSGVADVTASIPLLAVYRPRSHLNRERNQHENPSNQCRIKNVVSQSAKR